MGSWSPFSASAEYKNENEDKNTYGTHTPTLSDNFNDAFDASKSNLNANGATTDQQTAIDWTRNNLNNNPVNGATGLINKDLNAAKGVLNTTLWNNYDPLTKQDARAAQAYTSANAPTIDPKTGASLMDPYKELYSDELIDPSLAAYDYGTDRSFSALDARTAGAGAFGNDRSGLAYSDLGTQSALGRGKMYADLKTTGLNAAASLGQQDASRYLSADTSNAANLLSNNQYNANLLNQNAQFNVNSGYANDAQKMAATKAITDGIAQHTGLDQQILSNIVNENGIDTAAAQDLFTAGAITQEQLNAITQAAAAGNGYSYTQNENTTKNSVGAKVGVG